MSQASCNAAASKTKLRFSEDSDSPTVFSVKQQPGPRPRRKQKMYPILKTHWYDRGTKLVECPFKFTVYPLQRQYPLEGIPDGWEAVTHPEGNLYFYDCTRRIYTEAWLCDPEVLDKIEDFAVHLEEVAQEGVMVIPPGSELVLKLEVNLKENPETKHHWTYYYVDHAERVLFWLHDYAITDELEHLRGFHSASHISKFLTKAVKAI